MILDRETAEKLENYKCLYPECENDAQYKRFFYRQVEKNHRLSVEADSTIVCEHHRYYFDDNEFDVEIHPLDLQEKI